MKHSHPFTDEDIEAAVLAFEASPAGSNNGFVEDILEAAWKCAFARGAVSSFMDRDMFDKPGYFIKLPEDNTEDNDDEDRIYHWSHD